MTGHWAHARAIQKLVVQETTRLLTDWRRAWK